MKVIVCFVIIELTSILTSLLFAQPQIFNSIQEWIDAKDNGSVTCPYIDVNTLSYSSDGDFRTSSDCQIVNSANLFMAIWSGKIAMKKGEILLMQEYYPFFSLENRIAERRFSGSDNVRLDTLDRHTTVNKVEEDGDFDIYDMFMSSSKYNLDNFPDEYAKYSFVLQKYGVLSDFTLVPIKNQTQPISDWVKAQAFSPDNAQAEIMWHLTNDLECHATDTYGQEIDLISTYYSWKLDMEKGTAIFTPYFTPRQFKTTWQSGEPFSLLPEGEKIYNKSAPVDDAVSYDDDGRLVLHLWGLGNVTALNQNATETLSASAQNGTISIRGTNGNAVQLYNATGQQIYSGTSTEINVPTAGLYVLKCGSTTQKILVK